MNMKYLIFFAILFFSLPAFSQVTVSPDTIPGRYKIKTVNVVPGVGIQTVESESLDSAQIRERLLNTALSNIEAIERMKNDLKNLEKQAEKLRNHYGRFDAAGYYVKVGGIYGNNIAGKYECVEYDSLGEKIKNSKKVVDVSTDATGNITIKQGNNTGTVLVSSAASFTVTDFYKVKTADKTFTPVSFYRVGNGRYDGALGPRTVKLTRK